jgi:broad specificity phosphatase PhoE
MKKIFLFISLLASTIVFAQKTTYILIRHAEKDTTTTGSTMMNADPPLSKAGEARAQKLITALQAYTTDAVYSTNYKRTIHTVQPIANSINKQVIIYSPKDMNYFASQLLKEKDKTILIAGHSNTTPALVNLLIKKEEYKSLDESVYNKIFIVTITPEKTTVAITEY